MRIFLYGTLRHAGLLEIVAGQGLDALAPQAARLDDHAARWAEGHGFPLIVEEQGAFAEGLVLEDVSAETRARLDYYELGFGYELREVVLADGGAALVYFPRPGLWTAAARFDLDVWTQEYWPVVRHSAAEFMGYLGRLSSEEVSARDKMIQTRAVATALAEADRVPCTLRSNMARGEVRLARADLSHAGFFLLKTYHLRHPLFGGGMSEEMAREVFIAGDAATVLPYDPVRDRVLLIEQFRMGPYARGDAHPWTLEAIAGRIDGGESPESTALRETEEEAGLRLDGLEKIAAYYPTTGYSSEVLHAYLGLADLPDGAAGIAGLDAEHEDIRGHLVSFETAMALFESGEINNGPLILSLLWLARERDRLRAGRGAGAA